MKLRRKQIKLKNGETLVLTSPKIENAQEMADYYNTMITERVGNRIRELRSQTGLSQEKFALKIGMDRTYFASVELGKRNIALKNIEKIANGLGVTLSELFEGI